MTPFKTTPFKGILRYLLYIGIAGWMFFLGIMVGRGSSPVKFDTQKFQKRLEIIAKEFGEKEGVREKINLKFYDVLDRPVAEENMPSPKKILEIVPKKETTATDEIPVKTSRKKKTLKPQVNKAKTDQKTAEQSKPTNTKSVEIKANPIRLKKTGKSVRSTDNITPDNKPLYNKNPDNKNPKGAYTIQIAAFKNVKDAVAQMAVYRKKGFDSYRVTGEKNGVTWYRIRTGSFTTYDEAKKINEKLNKAGINSIIIKTQ
ncbi:SPOR domain-containing protein [Desulfobacula phenolica]|uniref:Sporulation related domain-containing protein n=1 Tax=Desulfobacula phenolica TaxID=90732 RepID=A0A1H2HIB7_9BACT|nr:SPOR domain-containing protein [Desulfobacula phenolica]SDU31532.1 Sporulation related domain-containing protein [Desulfobacula phenolica]